MANKPILDYEPLPPRGLRRRTVIALLSASAGVAIAAGGVVYTLSHPQPVAAAPASAPTPAPVTLRGDVALVPPVIPWTPASRPSTAPVMRPGDLICVPATLPWKPATQPAQPEPSGGH